MNQSQEYAYLAAVNPVVGIGLSNLVSGHTAFNAVFLCPKKHGTSMGGLCGAAKAAPLLTNGRPTCTVPSSLIGLGEADNSPLVRGHIMTTIATVTPSVFNFNELPVNTIADSHGEPWFLANDVCAILDYKNPRTALSNHCKAKGVLKQDTLTEGGIQEMTFINEGNLFRLIIKSRKPEAEKFEALVMEEILPAIRKTGSYNTQQDLPAIDVRSCLLDNLSTPTITLPSHIQKALDQKALALAFESHELCKEHLAKKIAFNCESGNPRKLNEKKALKIIEDTDLGSALAHTFYTKLQFIENIAHSAMVLANEYHATISASMTGNSQKKLVN
jgi:prophage antirepressor-like protein